MTTRKTITADRIEVIYLAAREENDDTLAEIANRALVRNSYSGEVVGLSDDEEAINYIIKNIIP